MIHKLYNNANKKKTDLQIGEIQKYILETKKK